jgi:hypothetical protein
MRLNAVNLTAVGIAIPGVAGAICDKCSGDKLSTRQRFGGARQDGLASLLVQQIDVARVHVHCRGESGVRRVSHVRAETLPIHIPMFSERQQNGGDAGNRSARFQQGQRVQRRSRSWAVLFNLAGGL